MAQAIALEDAHNRGQAQNIDLRDAVEGSYTPPASDEPIDVDPATGEVLEQTDNKKPAPVEPATKKPEAGNGPTIKDVLAIVNAGQYDDARALACAKTFSDNDRAEVDAAIKRHREGGEV